MVEMDFGSDPWLVNRDRWRAHIRFVSKKKKVKGLRASPLVLPINGPIIVSDGCY